MPLWGQMGSSCRLSAEKKGARGGPHSLALLLLVLTGTGCASTKDTLEGTVYIYLGLTEHQTLNAEIVKTKRERVGRFLTAFQSEHPGVHVQLQFYSEEDLPAQLRRRNGAGQGPDLLLINAETARHLSRNQLVRSIQPSDEVKDQILPETLTPLADGSDSYVGLPFVFEPQLACFNKALIQHPPSTLDELLALSDTTDGIGLPLNMSSLYWTLGSLGAEQSYARLIRGEKLTAEMKKTLLRWLRWLQDSNTHVGMYFYMSIDLLRQDFLAGKLAWVSCRSPFIANFAGHLTKEFETALLPNGRLGRASPLDDQRVWAFGVNSSENQRRIADAITAFSVNPLVQFRLTLGSDELLPVNRKVVIPVNSSPFLQTLKDSQAEGPTMSPELLNYLGDDELQTLTNELMVKLLYGNLTPEKTLAQLVSLLAKRTEGGRRRAPTHL